MSLSCVKESHIVDNICQYIAGSVTTDDWARLRDRTLTVSKFILTDVTKNSEALISPAAYFRLALSLEPGIPLFPHLSDLVIVDADASLSYLEFLLTPSLTSLEVSSIPNANQWILFSFLTSLAQVAPLLQTLTIGPGWFPSKSIMQTILQFKNLRQLELKGTVLKMTFAFLESLGTSLPALESLILDVRSCEYIPSTAIMSEDLSKGIEEHTPHAPFDTHRQKRRRVSAESDVGDAFSQLMKLHIIGSPLFLGDLILQIASTRLRDVFITVVTGMQAVDNAQTSEQMKKRQIQGEAKKMGKKRMKATNKQKKAREANNILFSALLQLLHGQWSTSLKKISVVNASGHSAQSTLLNEAFRLLLSHPTIKNLTVKGWAPDSVEDSILGLTELTSSNFKSLFLPFDEANSGISWSTLRHIAITCPKLQSLQCRIKPLSPIPEYSTTEALFHGLRTLSVGNSSWDLQSNKHHLIARHLDHLFPHLETITTFNHRAGAAEPWIAVDELIKMCQTARMDQRYRTYAIQAAADAMIT